MFFDNDETVIERVEVEEVEATERDLERAEWAQLWAEWGDNLE